MFKKGQTVRCVSDNHGFVNQGETYLVWKDSKTIFGEDTTFVIDVDGHQMDYPTSSFVLERDVESPAGHFKIGDLVRAIDDNAYMEEGTEFVVAYVADMDEHQLIGSEAMGEPTWYSFRFELVPTTVQAFNVGDTVRMVKAESLFYKTGDIGVITCALDGDFHYWVQFPHVDHECCVGACGEGYHNQMEVIPAAKFSVGQKVQVVEGGSGFAGWADGPDYGKVVTIAEVGYDTYTGGKDVKESLWAYRIEEQEGNNAERYGYKPYEGWHGEASFAAYVEPVAEPEVVAPRMFQVGDVVQLLTSDWPEQFPVGSLQTVTEVYERTGGVSFYIGDSEFYFTKRELALIVPVEDVQLLDATEDGGFQLTDDQPVLVETEVKPELFIVYGGTSIRLDTNNPASRQFAEAFLQLAYN